ncbi:MAG: 2OG-Fe dioxygenase family protein [Planctomycetes bacterium]|nr:2OG-Fe dioxygenase family protein [Planctomycetota bacterium]
MPPRTDFSFHLQGFPAAGLSELRSYFDRLPLDPYITGIFRRRRFSHFLGTPDRLKRLDHTYFVQSRSVNELAGGIKREFAELEDGIAQLPAFRAIVATYIDYLGIDPETTEMGVHQIRILCAPEFSGDPAPEGIHKDGFDYVGIFCVERHDVVGANTHLYRAKDQPPIFSRELQPGEVVFTDDRAIFHYTDPVRPSADHPGHRDVFVITA